MPDDEAAAPSWDELLRYMSGSLRRPEFQSSGAWAISELRRRLGEHWPERAWTPYGLPSGFDAAGFHTIAHCELLELALRLHSLDRLSGRGRAQRALRGDAAHSQVMHARIQLELAALAQQLGRTTVLESRAISPKDPVDVLVGEMPIEVFAVPPEDVENERRRAASEILDWLFMFGISHQVHIAGEVRSLLTSEERALLENELIRAAVHVREGAGEQQISDVDYKLTVMRREDATGRSLSGPTLRSDAWRKPAGRLRKKAQQARASGVRWLRCDVRNGLWQFTGLNKLSLKERAAQLAAATRQVMVEYAHIDGVVLSCGSLQAQSSFTDETTRGHSGEIGMRRVIFPLRVRELIVIPTNDQGREDSELWLALYDSEPAWLPCALEQAGLPSPEVIYGARSGPGSEELAG